MNFNEIPVGDEQDPIDLELKELFDEIYGDDCYQLLAQITCGDSNGYTDDEKLFELAGPAFLYLSTHHEGQSSQEYSWLSRLLQHYHPRPAQMHVGDDDCNEDLYYHLTKQRPYTVKYTCQVTVEVQVWADGLQDAEDKASNIEVTVEANDDPMNDVHVIDVQAVDHFDNFETTDDGPFVEDEPAEYAYTLTGHGGMNLTAKSELRGAIFLQGDEAGELYDKLERMKFQSHINTEIGAYFDSAEH